MIKILDKRNMSEEDWQKYRAKQRGIGGSEVASILNVNPYKAKFTLWLEKTGQKEVPEIDNDFVKWGNLLEPVIRKQFAKETGFKVFQNNFVLQHETYDFMIANLDGEVIDPNQKGRGVLEIKTTSEWNNKEWDKDHIPVNYMAQIQHYLAVTGYSYAYVVVLIGGNKLRWWFIERDDEIIDTIIQEEQAFIHAVESGEFPWTIGGSKDESDWLNSQYEEDNGLEMSIPQSIENMALEYNDIQDELKQLKTRAEAIKNQIKLEAKEYKILKGNAVKINMPTVNKTLFDSKAFQKDYSELYEQYKTKTSTYRNFNVTLLEA